MKRLLLAVPAMLLAASVCSAQSDSATANLTLTIGPEAAITVTNSPAFNLTGGTFGNYTTTTSLNWKVRTGSAATTAGITVKITQDFSAGGANGGPSVANPPTSGDLLTYMCTSDTAPTGSATACTGSQTASTNSATPVVVFGANTQSLKTGNSASTSWTLVDDPNYAAGSYTAVATYTISAV